jgi:hypothetical protein
VYGGGLGVPATGPHPDVYLTVWILAWTAHALATAPWSLLEANIFHPTPHALALSENMLGALPLYLPLAALSRDPIFAHQATLVLTFACAFLAALALVRDWTGSWWAAVVGGTLFAFSPFRAGNLAELHVLGNYYLPLVALAARRAVVTPGVRWPALLATVLVLQTLHSYYLGYAAFFAAATMAAVVLAGDATARRRWAALVVPIAVAGVVVALSALPYVHVVASFAPPPPELVRFYSARPGQTGATAAVLLALATLPFWRRGVRRGVGVWLVALAAAGVGAHLLALGPTLDVAGRTVVGPFRVLAAFVPGLGAMRGASRFNAVTTLAAAALGGAGVAGVLARLARPTRTIAGLAFVGFAAVALHQVLPHPLPIRPIDTADGLPPVYRWLAHEPAAPLLEVPLYDDRVPAEAQKEAVRVARTIHHWHPLLNGYSGHTPAAYGPVSGLARVLPDDRAVRLLARTTGLRRVVVHRAELAEPERRRWDEPGAALALVARFGDDVVYVVREPPPADLVPALLAPSPRATILGTPLAPVPADGRTATIAVEPAPPPSPDVAVRVTNPSRAVWPALASATAHLVTVGCRWEADGGAVVAADDDAARLPWDLEPGASVRVLVSLVAPARPATPVIGVVQDGVWFDGAVRVRP